MSITRSWMCISKQSQVLVLLPQGKRRVVMTSFLMRTRLALDLVGEFIRFGDDLSVDPSRRAHFFRLRAMRVLWISSVISLIPFILSLSAPARSQILHQPQEVDGASVNQLAPPHDNFVDLTSYKLLLVFIGPDQKKVDLHVAISGVLIEVAVLLTRPSTCYTLALAISTLIWSLESTY